MNDNINSESITTQTGANPPLDPLRAQEAINEMKAALFPAKITHIAIDIADLGDYVEEPDSVIQRHVFDVTGRNDSLSALSLTDLAWVFVSITDEYDFLKPAVHAAMERKLAARLASTATGQYSLDSDWPADNYLLLPTGPQPVALLPAWTASGPKRVVMIAIEKTHEPTPVPVAAFVDVERAMAKLVDIIDPVTARITRVVQLPTPTEIAARKAAAVLYPTDSRRLGGVA